MPESSTPKATPWAGEPYALKATASADVLLPPETADLLFEHTNGKKREATELVRRHATVAVNIKALDKFLKAEIDDNNQLDVLRKLRNMGKAESAEDVARLLKSDVETVRAQLARLEAEDTED